MPKKQISTDIGLYTQTGHKLTPNEEKFIEEYIKTGNATKAYAIAYDYDLTNPTDGKRKALNVRRYGSKLLNKGYIIEEINNRIEMVKNETIADSTEILQYFTDVMRGNLKDQFGLEAPLAERTKAAQELAKRLIDIQNKVNSTEAPEVKITVDWTRPDDMPTVRDVMLRQEALAEAQQMIAENTPIGQ